MIWLSISHRMGSLPLKVFGPVYSGQEGAGWLFLSKHRILPIQISDTIQKIHSFDWTSRIESIPVGEIRLRSYKICLISLLSLSDVIDNCLKKQHGVVATSTQNHGLSETLVTLTQDSVRRTRSYCGVDTESHNHNEHSFER